MTSTDEWHPTRSIDPAREETAQTLISMARDSDAGSGQAIGRSDRGDIVSIAWAARMPDQWHRDALDAILEEVGAQAGAFRLSVDGWQAVVWGKTDQDYSIEAGQEASVRLDALTQAMGHGL